MKRIFLLLIAALFFSSSAIAADKESLDRRTVSMEWESVGASIGYQLEVIRILKSGKRKKPLYFKTKIPKWEGKVAPGRYEVRLRSMDSRSVYGDWSSPIELWARLPDPEIVAPKANETIRSSDDDDTKIQFQWKKVKGADRYWLEVQTEGGDKIKSEEVSGNSASLSLPVAKKYLFRVHSLLAEEEKPELSQPPKNAFTLLAAELNSPKIDRPDSKFVTELNWTRPKYTGFFSYSLEHKNKGKWVTLESNDRSDASSLTLNPNYPGGTLKLTVVAHASLRLDSKPTILEFPVYDGIRTPQEIERAKLREAIERETENLFMASYLISSVNYVGVNKQTAKRATFSALTGTGRLGLAYMPKTATWGYSIVGDAGGMIIQNRNNIFYSLEAQALWRRYIWEVTQLRLYAGAFARQLPEAVKRQDNSIRVDEISVFGPHAGIQFWHPFTYRFGLQFNSQVIFASSSIHTPNGMPIVPTMSYQIGVLGSYKMKDNLTGFAGYAYRLDNMSYKAKPFDGTDLTNFAAPGDINSIEFTGHYLNLFLEWGF